MPSARRPRRGLSRLVSVGCSSAFSQPIRSFADGEGAFHGFQFTGDDTFAGKNVLSMALGGAHEMLLGAGSEFALWATASVRRDGSCTGRPVWEPVRSTRSSSTSSEQVQRRTPPPMTWQPSLEPWSGCCWRPRLPPAVARETGLTVLSDVMYYTPLGRRHYPPMAASLPDDGLRHAHGRS